MKRIRWLAVVAICLLAFGLRVYRLSAQSLWYDEGLSVYLAGLPPLDAIATSAVTDHPPLHTLLLGAWMGLAGRSEFAVRFLSAWCSVLAVALTWRVGRELMRDAAGMLGALLLALAPFAVYYAQETRGYSLLLALLLVIVWAFARIAKGVGWVPWAVLVLAGIAALYTHYYAALTILALNLAFAAVLACWLVSGARPAAVLRLAVGWLCAQLLIVLGFAPWLPAALAQAATNTTYFPGHVGWQTVVQDTLHAFVLGEAARPLPLALALAGGLAIAGAFVEQPGARRVGRVSVALLLAAPVAAMAVIVWNKPKFAPRYLIGALPAFCLLAGAGISALWASLSRPRTRRLLRPALAGAIVLALALSDGVSLGALYFDPTWARPDVRSVAAYITRNRQPGDVVVLLSGHQLPVFQYYGGSANVIALPPGFMPPVQSPLDYRAAADLETRLAGYSRLWLVYWQNELADPTGVVLDELASSATRLGVGQDFQGLRLLLFDLRGHKPLGAGPQQVGDWAFADPIHLVGFDLDSGPRAPGQPVDLALYWRSDGPIQPNYTVFTHLVGPDGQQVAVADHIAGADSYPTSLWKPGSLVRNTFRLTLPPNAQPGLYHLQVGLYDERGRLLLAGGNDCVVLAELVVQ